MLTGYSVRRQNHIKSIYDDRWLGDTFHYTGMGMSGDQSLEFMQNKTLANSPSNGVAIHLFEVFEEKIYTYMGPVELSAEPYAEIQSDEQGDSRQVWMFPLKLIAGKQPTISQKIIQKYNYIKGSKAKKLSDQELSKRAQISSKKAGNRTVASTQYDRNIWVSEYSKRKANGVCQLCKLKAPFRNHAGQPYLETHHIKWLSKGGDDSIENTVALCPNCHRKMHILNLREDIKILQIRAKN